MGEEISRSLFSPQDFSLFSDRLEEETGLFSNIAANGHLSQNGFVCGFEIEAWLLDHSFFPNPINEQFLSLLSNALVVPELSRFNVELNCEPAAMTGDVLSRTGSALSALWDQSDEVAHTLDAQMVMIGTLPIIRDEDLTLKNLSPLKRYDALNSEILRQRSNRPVVVEISGDQRLHSEHRDVMLEAATTSFQIHLKAPASVAHRYFNASMMATGPLLAACVNSPFLFGRALWQETRIPLFEQAIALTDREGAHGRVTFGSGYVGSGLAEAFSENLQDYPVLLPILFDEPARNFRHLRLHNGTIWRWNRPLLGFDNDDTPHVRIEHRCLPAGPTMIDMIANAACYFGLVRHFVDTGFDERGDLTFADARANFYEAARHGLDARLTWPGASRVGVRSLLLDELIPAARWGLGAFGIDENDRDLYLDLVEARVRSQQTGAAWQRAELSRCGGDFTRLMAAYCEGQHSGLPAHQWDL
jgi:hypothetical protein